MDGAISGNIKHESSSSPRCLIQTWISCALAQSSNSPKWCCQQLHPNFRSTPSWDCQHICTAGQNSQCLGYNLVLGLLPLHQPAGALRTLAQNVFLTRIIKSTLVPHSAQNIGLGTTSSVMTLTQFRLKKTPKDTLLF